MSTLAALTNLPYDVQKDFEPVTMIARGPMVLCVHPSRPYRTLPELVAAAKARPDTLTYGTTGIGSNGHLTVAALCQLTGMQARARALSRRRAAVERRHRRPRRHGDLVERDGRAAGRSPDNCAR